MLKNTTDNLKNFFCFFFLFNDIFVFITVLVIFFLIFLLLEDKSQASETTYIYLTATKYSHRFFSHPHLCFGDFYEQNSQAKSSSIASSKKHS